jgi:hypothetical protein
VARFSSFLRNPLSFLFVRSTKEERVARYVILEHQRGRRLEEIVKDPYIRNRVSERELARILDRPEVVGALGRGAVSDAQQQLT